MAKLEWAILISEVVSQLNAEEKQMAIDFRINGNGVRSEAPADTPLLWVIREQLKLMHEIQLRRRFVWGVHGPH